MKAFLARFAGCVGDDGAPRLVPGEASRFKATLQAFCNDLAAFSSLMADWTVSSADSAICLILIRGYMS